MRKAYELNTYDLSMAAAYGYALIFSGNYADGTPIMERAVEVVERPSELVGLRAVPRRSSCSATWRRARTRTEALATAKRSHYLAARHARGAGRTATSPTAPPHCCTRSSPESSEIRRRSGAAFVEGQLSARPDRKVG